MRVKLKDIKQGKTFWVASICYDSKGMLRAYTERIFIKGRPYINPYTDSIFVDYVARSVYSDMFHNSRSLLDDNVIPNCYNLHGLFTSRKSAQRHIDRIASRCLTQHEAEIRLRMLENAKEDYFCFSDYDEVKVSEICDIRTVHFEYMMDKTRASITKIGKQSALKFNG